MHMLCCFKQVSTISFQLWLFQFESCNKEKDLGVIVDSKLNFRDHINTKVNLANQNLGIIFRIFTYLDQEVFLNLF